MAPRAECEPTVSLLSQVDGMDVLCVREATQFAADHCRAGKVSEVELRGRFRRLLVYADCWL